MTNGCRLCRPTSGESAGISLVGSWNLQGRLCFAILQLAIFTFTGLAAPKISKVRVGAHEGFTRLVFEVEGGAQVRRPRISSGKIWLSFLGAETDLQPTPLEGETIRSVEFVREKETLSAAIGVMVEQFELRLFSLSEPHRIVLDVIPQPQSAVLGVSESKGTKSSELIATPSSRRPGVKSQLTGLVVLELLIFGVLTFACFRLLRSREEVVLRMAEPDAEFKHNVAAIDASIRKEIRSYDRLKLRKQE